MQTKRYLLFFGVMLFSLATFQPLLSSTKIEKTEQTKTIPSGKAATARTFCEQEDTEIPYVRHKIKLIKRLEALFTSIYGPAHLLTPYVDTLKALIYYFQVTYERTVKNKKHGETLKSTKDLVQTAFQEVENLLASYDAHLPEQTRSALPQTEQPLNPSEQPALPVNGALNSFFNTLYTTQHQAMGLPHFQHYIPSQQKQADFYKKKPGLLNDFTQAMLATGGTLLAFLALYYFMTADIRHLEKKTDLLVKDIRDLGRTSEVVLDRVKACHDVVKKTPHAQLPYCTQEHLETLYKHYDKERKALRKRNS